MKRGRDAAAASDERKKKKQARPSKQEEKLQRELFGSGEDAVLAAFAKEKEVLDTGKTEEMTDNEEEVLSVHLDLGLSLLQGEIPLAIVGLEGAFELEDAEETKDEEGESLKPKKHEDFPPAWQDEDDEAVVVHVAETARLRKLRKTEEENALTGTEYANRLRKTFESLNAASTWATLPTDPDADVHTVLHSSALVEKGRSGRLPPSRLDLTRLNDLPEPCNGVVQSVVFHPSSRLVMTASLDKRVHLFNVDGKNHPKVKTVFLSDLPVRCASFSRRGREIVCTGRRKHFYSIDVETSKPTRIPGIRGSTARSLETMVVSPCGRYIAMLVDNGTTLLLSAKTKQRIAALRMTDSVRAASFAPDGESLLTFGGAGLVSLWDVKQRRCVAQHTDDGCVEGTAVASTMSEYVTGQDSGCVNFYKGTVQSGAVKPVKTFMHLTTGVDFLCFNGKRELLAMASRRKKDALKLVHVPSLTVFENWPTSRTPLHYVSAFNFSPQGGYMAIGNARGRVLMYRVNHYLEA